MRKKVHFLCVCVFQKTKGAEGNTEARVSRKDTDV